MLFFSTDVFRELLARAIMFHKNYCSDLVYIAEPLLGVTNEGHMLLPRESHMIRHITRNRWGQNTDRGL